jgi:hypothetical protein
MCDPVTGTLAAIGAVAGLAGTMSQGMSAKSAADYNAKIASDQAKQVDQQAAFDVAQNDADARRRLATQKAAYGASGVVTDSGSPLEVAAEDTKQAALDDMTIRYNAALQKRGLRAQAAADRASGSRALSGSIFSAGETLATRGAGMYLAYHPPIAGGIG